jgi:peptidoglycan/LPS O-acetylase OafA/YrhL
MAAGPVERQPGRKDRMSTPGPHEHREPISTAVGLPKAVRLPTLDGWRAVSIILVLGSHCYYITGIPLKTATVFTWLFDGSLGVRFFFVISGFLITWLLLVEQREKGRISRRDFYIRRALRILPVYYAFLAVLLALQALGHFYMDGAAWMGCLTFTTNFVGINSTYWTSGHLWSLAQEEQFYLLWPTLFILSGAGRRVSTVACILAVPILLCPVIRVLAYLKVVIPLLTSGKGLSSCDSIAVGCASAIIFTALRHRIRDFVSSHGTLVWAVGAALILIPYTLARLLLLAVVLVPLGETFQAVGFAILLLHSVSDPRFPLYRALGWRWVSEIGILSYSIYIWQQIFCTKPSAFGMGPVWWMSFPGWIIPAFLTATASFYFLERPLFRLRARFRSP